MTKIPIDTKKYSENGLLVWLKCRFCNEDTPCDGCIRLEQGCREKQAYKQIVALIKKPQVTEEWIDDSIKEASVEIYNLGYYPSFKPKEISTIIHKLVKEIKNG